MHQIREIDEVDGFLPQQLSYLFQMVDDGKIQLLIVSLLHEERITTPLSGKFLNLSAFTFLVLLAIFLT